MSSPMNIIISDLQKKIDSFAVLKISISSTDNQFIDLYKSHIDKHNNSIFSDPFPNAGFDLFVPESIEIPNISETSTMISMNVKCEMLNSVGKSCAYYMYPRSSLSKTPLVLGNHVGIIDSGYRGNLIGAFRNLDKRPFLVDKFTRLLQICHSSLCPIYVVIVNETELSTTSRGSGGFGSTGR